MYIKMYPALIGLGKKLSKRRTTDDMKIQVPHALLYSLNWFVM